MKRLLPITALAGIAAIALMRCIIAFVPDVYFDFDPAVDPAPLAGMGKGGSLFLDALLLVFCALGFIEIALRGQLQGRLVLLAFLPLPVIMYHGWDDAGDIWRGTSWFASAVAAVVVAHLARDRALLTLMTALLLAVIALLPLPLLSFAGHYSGASITYDCLGGNQYRVYLDLFLDCSGTDVTPPDLTFKNNCGTTMVFQDLQPVSVQEISPLCPDELQNSSCNGGAMPELLDASPGPEEIVIHRSILDELRVALDTLPERQAEIIELRLAGLTIREIAEIQGTSEDATKTAQTRAFKSLRTRMERRVAK